MKKTGMSRKIDDLGRVVIPAEMRKGFGLKDGDYLEISVDQDRIVLSKRQDICIICSSTTDLKEFKERMICATCVRELAGEGDVQAWEPFSAE
jgi:transcriptional pleiotropic regulator of transition state genes